MKRRPKNELSFKELAANLAERSIVTKCLARFIEMTFEALHKEIHDTQIVPAHKAIAALVANPHGCTYCDYGKLRIPPEFPHSNPFNTHDKDCGFAMAETILAVQS
jgi:hypothetical protein